MTRASFLLFSLAVKSLSVQGFCWSHWLSDEKADGSANVEQEGTNTTVNFQEKKTLIRSALRSKGWKWIIMMKNFNKGLFYLHQRVLCWGPSVCMSALERELSSCGFICLETRFYWHNCNITVNISAIWEHGITQLTLYYKCEWNVLQQ